MINAFYNFPEGNSEAISNILSHPPLNENGLIIYLNLSKILEKNKLNTLSRIIKYRLDSDPEIKIIACIKFVEHIEILSELLSNYNPIIVRGKSRNETDNYRLIIVSCGHLKCLGRPYITNQGSPQYVYFTEKFYSPFSCPTDRTRIELIYDKNNENEFYRWGRKNKDYPRFIED